MEHLNETETFRKAVASQRTASLSIWQANVIFSSPTVMQREGSKLGRPWWTRAFPLLIGEFYSSLYESGKRDNFLEDEVSISKPAKSDFSA